MVSLLFDIDETEFSNINQFIENLEIANTYYDASVLEQEYDTQQLTFTDLIGENLEDLIKNSYYVRYEGSLTYEPCSEGVEWIVVLEKLNNINALQIGDLKMLSGGEKNNRDT